MFPPTPRSFPLLSSPNFMFTLSFFPSLYPNKHKNTKMETKTHKQTKPQ